MRLREIVLASALGLGFVGCSSLQTGITYSSVQIVKFSNFLDDLDIEYNFFPSSGTRMLFAIGERHEEDTRSIRKEAYIRFCEVLDKNYEVDKVFVEGAIYKNGPGLDINSLKKVSDVKEQHFNLQALINDDSTGYFSFSKFTDFVGIENYDVYLEADLLSNLEMSLRHFKLAKYDKNEFAINFYSTEAAKLASKLQFIKFKIDEPLEKINAKGLDLLIDKAGSSFNYYGIEKRNKIFVDIIDKELKDGSLGVLIVGRDHLNPNESLKQYGNLIDYCNKKGINVVYIDYKKILNFYKDLTGG